MEINTGHVGLDRIKWIVNNVSSIMGDTPWRRVITGYCNGLSRSGEGVEYQRLLDIVSNAPDDMVDEKVYVLNAILLRAFQTSLSYGISIPNIVPPDRPEMIELAEKLLQSPNGKLTLVPLSMEGISRYRQITTNRDIDRDKDKSIFWGKPKKPTTEVKENITMKDEEIKTVEDGQEGYQKWEDYVVDRRKHRLGEPDYKGSRVNDVNSPRDEIVKRTALKVSAGESFKFPGVETFQPLINCGTPTFSKDGGIGISIKQLAIRKETAIWYTNCFKASNSVEGVIAFAKKALEDGETAYTADKLLSDMTDRVNYLLKMVIHPEDGIRITHIEDDWESLDRYLNSTQRKYLREALSRFHRTDVKEDVPELKMKRILHTGIMDFLDGEEADLESGIDSADMGLGGYLRLDPYISVSLNDEDAGTALFDTEKYLVISKLHHKNLVQTAQAVMDMSGTNACTLYTRASKFNIIKACNTNGSPSTTYLMRRVK